MSEEQLEFTFNNGTLCPWRRENRSHKATNFNWWVRPYRNKRFGWAVRVHPHHLAIGSWSVKLFVNARGMSWHLEESIDNLPTKEAAMEAADKRLISLGFSLE